MGPDSIDHQAAVAVNLPRILIPAQEGQQHPNAKIEAFENKEADVQHRNQYEPQGI
jgi:hypothetical protein